MKNSISLKFGLLFLSFGMIHIGLWAQLQCENDTTGLKALIDLQTGYYLGFMGGLYPAGKNEIPYTHFAAGMNISRQIIPLDTNGVFDSENGKAGFICLGASTAGNAFNHFKDLVEADSTVNPCLKVVNCAVGAKGLEVMNDTLLNDWYWDDNVIHDINTSNLNRRQVQVAWIMVTSRVDTSLFWPKQPRDVTDKYEVLMPILLDKFPNLKEVFISGFPYGGYADPSKEFYDMIVEPSSYWNNWSVKFLVERQIKADPGLKYTEPGRKSAWIAWGPPLWADGMRANFVDGLRWNCMADFKPDGGGYHLSDIGKDKEGEIIYNFFKNSLIAADWFKASARWAACDPAFRESAVVIPSEISVSLYPNPSNGTGYVAFDNLSKGIIDIRIYNMTGEIVYRENQLVSDGFYIMPLHLESNPSGMYHISIQNSGRTAIGECMITK